MSAFVRVDEDEFAGFALFGTCPDCLKYWDDDYPPVGYLFIHCDGVP
jgi:hypothetical protein